MKNARLAIKNVKFVQPYRHALYVEVPQDKIVLDFFLIVIVLQITFMIVSQFMMNAKLVIKNVKLVLIILCVKPAKDQLL